MDLSFEYSLDMVDLPLVVTSSKPYLCFLIDTGATHNIIFSYVYDTFQDCFTSLKSEVILTGIEGNNLVSNQVESIVTLGKEDLPVVFSVLQTTKAISKLQQETGVQIHGILGIPFLKENKCLIDFKTLTLSN